MIVDPSGKPLIPHAAKLFPAHWKIGDATVTLNADGTCSGDIELALEELADLPPDPNVPLLWLLANALRGQLQENARSPSTASLWEPVCTD